MTEGFRSWRYRWLMFYIDSRRALLVMDGVAPEIRDRERQRLKNMVSEEYGTRELDAKFDRWAGLSPHLFACLENICTYYTKWNIPM